MTSIDETFPTAEQFDRFEDQLRRIGDDSEDLFRILERCNAALQVIADDVPDLESQSAMDLFAELTPDEAAAALIEIEALP